MIFIFGLGNTGEKYKNNRHNVGRMIVESLRQKWNFPSWKKNKYTKAEESRGSFSGSDVTFLIYDEFMNTSGRALSKNFDPQNDKLIVVYDDLDIPFGEIKFSFDRGSGGHNGIKSIEDEIKTQKFYRIRVGISPKNIFGKMRKPVGKERVVRHVLGDFSLGGRKKVTGEITDRISSGIETFIKRGPEIATTELNSAK
ncbi:MAG: peptidyl-tRNA hydrolase [Candidatus Nomurabacteria bacterium]|nr:MAG: peptidyl-tRNA hydrolase [Candidatus Nomurabacteria bacterium]